MDCQTGIVSIYAKDLEGMLARAASVLKRARRLCLIHVQVGFYPNLPQISPRNILRSAIKASPSHQQLF